MGYLSIWALRKAFSGMSNWIKSLVYLCLLSASPAGAEENLQARAALQRALTYFGFPAGEPDGLFGLKTKNAISALQSCVGLAETGNISQVEQSFVTEAYQIANAQKLTGSCVLLQSYLETGYQCPAANWTELFSCKINGSKKQVTVCAAIDQVRYTFGTTGQIPKIRLQSMLTQTYVPWMGLGRYVNDDLSMTNDDMTYRVYSSLDRSIQEPSLTGGIDVIQSNKIIAALQCDQDSIYSNIPEASSLLEIAGLCWDKESERWAGCSKMGGWQRYVEGPVFPYEAYQLGEFISGCAIDGEDANIQEQAYEFALYLQELIRVKDLPSLYGNVRTKLINGPSKEQASGKDFDQFFSDKWGKTFLSIEPGCTKVGTKGYMISGGLIWFDRLQDETSKQFTDVWTIISINNDITTPKQ